jgi:hypothetical protein
MRLMGHYNPDYGLIRLAQQRGGELQMLEIDLREAVDLRAYLDRIIEAADLTPAFSVPRPIVERDDGDDEQRGGGNGFAGGRAHRDQHRDTCA